MAVRGLVAVGVTDSDVFSVTALPVRLLDDAIAGGENRRAHGGGPVDAGVHLGVPEQRMIAAAEARGHGAVGDRLAHQKLLRTLAALVVVVDRVVVCGLEAVELPGLAASGEQRVEHVVFAAVAGVL